jgi:hypothetical protein
MNDYHETRRIIEILQSTINDLSASLQNKKEDYLVTPPLHFNRIKDYYEWLEEEKEAIIKANAEPKN